MQLKKRFRVQFQTVFKRWLGETGHDVRVSGVPKWDDTDKERREVRTCVSKWTKQGMIMTVSQMG